MQGPKKPRNELKETLMLAIPTIFDLLATVLMNVGLLWVTASVYQVGHRACDTQQRGGRVGEGVSQLACNVCHVTSFVQLGECTCKHRYPCICKTEVPFSGGAPYLIKLLTG
jgi:hypothetical protein